MRAPSRPPAGAGTAGGPACAPVAVAAARASSEAWTAGAAAGTPCRAPRVPCRPPPVPVPSRLLASSTVKYESTVKSKHHPSPCEGCEDPGEAGGVTTPQGPTTRPPCQPYSLSGLAPRLFSFLKTSPPASLGTSPWQVGPGDRHRFDLTKPTSSSSHICALIVLFRLISVQKICALSNGKKSKTQNNVETNCAPS